MHSSSSHLSPAASPWCSSNRTRADRSPKRAELAAQLAATNQDNKWLTEEIDRQKAALGATQELLDKAEHRLRDVFQSAAAEALKDSRSAFLDLAKTSFAAFHQPLRGHVEESRRQAGGNRRDRIAAYSRLSEQVAALGSTATTLARVANAGRPSEAAGVKCSCAASWRYPEWSSGSDFDEQPPLTSDNGRVRPDLIVRLPGAKRIVVDAKALLEAFLDAQDAGDDETRLVEAQAHARQVRDHMDRLGNKGYWEALGDSPEMVVMFLPGETLFSAGTAA